MDQIFFVPPPPHLDLSESRIPPDQKGIDVRSLMIISTSLVLKQCECAAFVVLFSLFTFYSLQSLNKLSCWLCS